MKTPRQILFDEHGSADAELERIQARVLALGLRQPAKARRSIGEQAHSVVAMLWAELFVPARRIWIGFGVAWLVIAAVNFGGMESQPRQAKSKPATATMLLAWKEQQRLAIELTNPLELQLAEPPRSPAPKPRSQREATTLIG